MKTSYEISKTGINKSRQELKITPTGSCYVIVFLDV